MMRVPLMLHHPMPTVFHKQGQQDIFPETEAQQEEPALCRMNDLEELWEGEHGVDYVESYDSIHVV